MNPTLRRGAFAFALSNVLFHPTLVRADKPAGTPGHKPPNILLVVLDDVGIDQMKSFGYGGQNPPPTPAIDRVAASGIRFRNTWAMPACTTSRSVMYDARFPFRTNVLGALGPDDLANSMVSPYEMTTPKLLATRGYTSALFGKFHITLQGKDPAGVAAPHVLGWNYFAGWTDETGDPSSIDATAGGVATGGKTYSCGFVPSAAAGGADAGACYMANGSCTAMQTENGVPPGRICRDRGGILDPGKDCGSPRPAYLDFSKLSGHYVSPLTINAPDGSVTNVDSLDPRARSFRARWVVDAAVDWIRTRPANEPWMATVSFASDHTPLMQPPYDEAVGDNASASDIDCQDPAEQQHLSDLLIESMDSQIERLLLELDLAERGKDGQLEYDPKKTDTMLVILGDNGSLGATVKDPFDMIRSKGTTYQTGVWVPLIVAGPLMRGPARDNPHMINVADLYTLFAEVAGIDDVEAEVPRPIDAEPMLAYLEHPRHRSIRKWNFTQVGINLQANGTVNGPCTIGGTCTQIPVTKGVCEDNGGIWWGEQQDPAKTGYDDPNGFRYCCEVNRFVVERGCDPASLGCPFGITPLVAVGIRNKHFKIVRNSVKAYVDQTNFCHDVTTDEFYRIDEAVPTPMLDETAIDGPRTRRQQKNYESLSSTLAALLASKPDCPGDGNIDFVVDQKDLDGWAEYQGGSSVFDFTLDGKTDEADRAVIESHLGAVCTAPAAP